LLKHIKVSWNLPNGLAFKLVVTAYAGAAAIVHVKIGIYDVFELALTVDKIVYRNKRAVRRT